MTGCFSVTSSYPRDRSTEDEAVGFAIPDGFRLQESSQAALDGSSVKRRVLVGLSMGWFGGFITGNSQERNEDLYGYYCAHDTSTRTKACGA